MHGLLRTVKRFAILSLFLSIVASSVPLHATPVSRFFKAECATSAGYIEVAGDGTYRVIWREHMGVMTEDRGRWKQKLDIITFSPENVRKTPYQAAEVKYNDRVFLAWKSEGAPGIVLPVRDTEQELDADPKAIPLFVFFEIGRNVFEQETKFPYPFRYIKPS